MYTTNESTGTFELIAAALNGNNVLETHVPETTPVVDLTIILILLVD